jgi:ABC-type proline/glycine betaine transport system substrate-binding protein
MLSGRAALRLAQALAGATAGLLIFAGIMEAGGAVAYVDVGIADVLAAALVASVVLERG